MRAFLLVALLVWAAPTIASAQASAAEPVVVVARVAVEPTRGWPACGVLAVLGEVVFETVRVERGEFTASRFVGVIQCPSRAYRGVLRLTLSSRRSGLIGSVFGEHGPDDLPRFYVRSEELAEAPAGLASYLGRLRHELAAVYPASRAAGGWTHYGEVVSVQIEDRRIVAIRARVPGAMSCEDAARWIGVTDPGPPLRRANGCEWPGISDRHRLGPGLVGSFLDGVFELRRASPRGR